MAYPGSANLVNQLKTRAYSEASSTTTGAPIVTVPVPFRAKYLYTVLTQTNYVSQTGAGLVNLAVNGSTATADSFVTNPIITVTTSTGNGPGFTSQNANTAVLYLNQGDSLTTVGSSMCPYTIAHILQEF